jgi:hypothetical protein
MAGAACDKANAEEAANSDRYATRLIKLYSPHSAVEGGSLKALLCGGSVAQSIQFF